MAGFFLSRSAPSAAVHAQFHDHGFAEPRELSLPGWTLLHYSYTLGGPEMLLTRGEDWIAVAGSFVFDGRMGTAALEDALAHLDPLAPDWRRIGGQFALVLHRGGRTFLLSDFFGCFQAFHDADDRFFSTSFLAAARALPRASFSAQGVYEWAFNVVPLGRDTVLAELQTHGPEHVVELIVEGTRRHRLDKALRPIGGDPLRTAADALQAIVAPHVAAFGDDIFCPLSGGLDSRLVLAALRAAGSKPHLYVYGPNGSEDVEIAQAIGRAEGIRVEHINKGAHAAVAPEVFPELVEANFHQFDALPTYGNIFDNGGHAAAQFARHVGGALTASGGAGEIFRNFFYLPNHRIRPHALASTFFARFDSRDATDLFAPAEFLHVIEGKIADALGLADTRAPIDRLHLEEVYPRVRAAALFGREISLEARFSPYLMPFLDQQLVAEAMTLPLHAKNAGRFEAQLIHAIDPALARHPSAYGHHFAGPPNLRHRFDEWSTRVRPPWVRRATYALRRRMGAMHDEHGGLLSPDYMGRVIDLEFPAMRRFFRMERIADSGMWRRIACLEYLAKQLNL